MVDLGEVAVDGDLGVLGGPGVVVHRCATDTNGPEALDPLVGCGAGEVLGEEFEEFQARLSGEHHPLEPGVLGQFRAAHGGVEGLPPVR